MSQDDAGMTGVPRARRQLVFDLVPMVLVVVAEGTWVSVVGWLVQEYALRHPVLGIPAMAAFVLAGVVAARTLARRAGERWPGLALAIVVAGGIAGWLLSPDARAALPEEPVGALAAHPGGWLAAVAVLRGFAHSSLPLAEGSVGRLLGLGVPGLAAAGLLGGLIREPFRTEFLGQALVAAVVFVGTATPALALTRLNAIGRPAGFDWRRNPLWAAVVVLLVATAVGLALPLAGVAGVVLDALLAVALVPLLVLGFSVGFDRTGKRILAFTAGAVLVILALGRILPASPFSTAPIQIPVEDPAPETGTQFVTVGFGGLILALVVAAILVLAAAWMRRQRADEDEDVFEIRTIDRNIGPVPPRRRPRPWRRTTRPTDATAAYLALLRDLEPHPHVRRASTETPAEHARRLRTTRSAGLAPAHRLGFDLLAADYALDRFGGLPLGPREHGRAVERWRTLRRALVRPRAGSGGARENVG